MNHDELEPLAAEYVLHVLEPEEQQAFQEHLATCETCARKVAELQALVGALPLLVEDREPPPGLRERILAAARVEDVSLATPDPSAGPRMRWFARPVALAVVLTSLLLAVVALAFLNLRLQNSLENSQTQLQNSLAAREGQLANTFQAINIMAQAEEWWRFEGTEAAPQAAGVLAYSEQHSAACLVVWGLPSFQDKDYPVWAIKEGVPTRVGRMWAMSSGLWVVIPGSLEQLDRMEITLEDVRDPSAPGGPVVISIPLSGS